MSRATDNILQRTTMLIRCTTPYGKNSGTGFMFSFLTGDGDLTPLLVTNKHVMEGAQEVRIRVTLSDGENFDSPIGIADYCLSTGWERLWRGHPDPDVDLAFSPSPGC